MKNGFDRIVILVLDSTGVGGAPDAGRYGDVGSATLPHIADAVGGLRLPTLQRLGLGCIVPIAGVAPAAHPEAAHGRLTEASPGKDSTTGHWELMGVILDRPFPTYPHGFPPEVMRPFEQTIGTRTLGNVAASGTEIIARLGPEHQRTGFPIVYTSADSVFQVAAHEDVIPVTRLYEICEIARRLLTGPHAVSRVIARPFIGAPGSYVRTDRRRDFSVLPPTSTVLDAAVQAGWPVVGIGKIPDLFGHRGLTAEVHTHDDLDGMAQTVAALDRTPRGIVMTNLVDLDTKFGHRNDPRGYAADLEAIDGALPQILDRLTGGDLFVVTADHGNDPTTPSTDHAREQVPMLWTGPRIRPVDLGVGATFADVGATVADALGIPWTGPGTSLLPAMASDRLRPS